MQEYSLLFLFNQPVINYKQILYLSRLLPTLLSIIMAFFIFFFAKKRFDIKTGFYTSIIYLFHPLILTHSSIAYIDLAFMFFNFFAFMFFLEFIKSIPTKPSTKHFLLFSLFFSLALMSKFTGLHGFLFYLLAFLLNWRKTKTFFTRNIKQFIILLVLFVAIQYVMILCFYSFQNLFKPVENSLLNDHFIKPSDHKLRDALSFFHKNKITEFVFTKIPSPLPYYFVKGAGYWVFDYRTRSGGFHLVKAFIVFIAKNPLAWLILLLLALILVLLKGYLAVFPKNSGITKKSRVYPKHQASKHEMGHQKIKNTKSLFYEFNFLLYSLFYFIVFGVFGSYNYARYTLMIYPFLILLSAYAIHFLISRRLEFVVVILIILYLGSVLSQYPNFYSYESVIVKNSLQIPNDLPTLNQHLLKANPKLLEKYLIHLQSTQPDDKAT